MKTDTTSLSKILAVDDHHANIAIMEEMLGETYDLKTAMNGLEALDIAAAFKPDIVLLDIMMPDIDGYEVCRRIRANSDLRFTKIIMVSAKAMASERIKGYEAGADDYIVKPFDVDEFAAKVQVYVRLKSVEELDRIKSEFTMTVTHELRTPMTIIKNILDNATAKTYGEINPKLNQQLAIAEQNVTRLGNIVANFFDISKIEAGKMEMNLSSFDIRQLVSKTVKALEAQADTRRIKLNISAENKELKIYADHEKVGKVLKHLIDNAVKFTNEGDCVTVLITDLADAIRIDIKDNGPGIDAGDVRKVFDRFVQLQKHIGAGEHGTGLGLSIVKSFVEMHGGQIWVESILGNGSNFCFVLPKVRQPNVKDETLKAYSSTCKSQTRRG